MTIQEAQEIISPYIEESIINFVIEKHIFIQNNGREIYNKIIRDNVDMKFGVYVWVETDSKDIIYIGMAGKIKSDGSLGNHSIQKRLLASRGKNKTTKKDILSNDFVYEFMRDNKIDTLNFYVMYSKKEEPPAFIEALLLYKFYKKHKRLPKLNYSF